MEAPQPYKFIATDALRELGNQVEEIKPVATSEEFQRRVDIFTFVSFDLVGSTGLKAVERSWPQVINYFYDISERLAREFIGGTKVWKYLGDEILLYKLISSPVDASDLAMKAFTCLRAVIAELETEFEFAKRLISVKGIVWAAPIIRLSREKLAEDVAEQHKALIGALHSDDLTVSANFDSERRPFDFLGPNIDAGFRLAAFARAKQLVVSPMLANYMRQKRAHINDVKVVDFAQLKGVARGALYPGLWYHENWQSIKQDFRYDQRVTDAVARRVCAGSIESIDLLAEITELPDLTPYFIDCDLVDRIIINSSKSSEELT